jgi:hypothetical protein
VARGFKTGGRKPGVRNRRTQSLLNGLEESGLMPLDYLLSIMRDNKQDVDRRIDAAKAAAAYCHPRLAQIESTINERERPIISHRPLTDEEWEAQCRMDGQGAD